ncbi:MAG: OsmC family protein [Bacteroidales bacterium]|jgi:putative redox protein|nr:OsmC family protein [Bacteroidales bacterium]
MDDKNTALTASIKLINNKLHFEGHAGDNAPVSIDYIAPLGDDLGYTSQELLLLSYSSCLGSAVLTFLRRMGKTIRGFEIQAKGIRHTEHPTGFSTIHIEMELGSPDVLPEDLEKVIALAKEKYCPVWAMIKGNVDIIINYSIHP